MIIIILFSGWDGRIRTYGIMESKSTALPLGYVPKLNFRSNYNIVVYLCQYMKGEQKMNIFLKDVKNDKTYEIKKGSYFLDIAKIYESESGKKVYGIKYNNSIKELFKKVDEDGEIEFLDLSTLDGVRIYQRGLLFVLYMAVKKLDITDQININHSVGNGLYCELKNSVPDENYLDKIKTEMTKIISSDLKFSKENMDKFDAIDLFNSNNLEDKSLLLKYRKKSTINIYRVDGFFNYMYGYMPLSTSYVDKFDLKKIDEGFMLIHPNENSPEIVPEFKHLNKLSQTFKEYKEWLKIMEIKTVGELNELIAQGKSNVIELIRVVEALHEKKYAMIADEIIKEKNKRLILLAGPSSSGKTTSAKRIALQLKVNGLKPFPVSLDDYFVERERTPKDEFGKPDFESINALDIDLFNQNLKDLLEEKETELPKFDFVQGKKVWTGKKVKLEKDQPVIIEGIHGLNEQLTEKIPREQKFKIYVSALTQMNLDSHNRIPTTDTRLIRRIVRDYNFRGHSALGTLKMWPSVRRGEENNIFPFQEDADIMFNSFLAYELAVLKIYAEPLLLQITNKEKEFTEAKRLLRFLDYFLPITELEEIPRKSVIREFIGKSTFEY